MKIFLCHLSAMYPITNVYRKIVTLILIKHYYESLKLNYQVFYRIDLVIGNDMDDMNTKKFPRHQ